MRRPTMRAESGLTDRQWEILGLVAEGLTNQAIAARLWIAHKTVEGHVNHIYHALATRGEYHPRVAAARFYWLAEAEAAGMVAA